MREFFFKIDSNELNGLRRSKTELINIGKASQCHNVLAGEKSLEPLDPVINPFENISGLPENEFPFPQMLIKEYFTILCYKTQIYIIDSNYNVSKIFDFGEQPSWNNTVWDIINYYSITIITNGHVFVWYNLVTDVWEQLQSNDSLPLFLTGCVFNGRIIVGNIKNNWYDCDNSSISYSKINNLFFKPTKSNDSGYIKIDDVGDILNILKLGNDTILYGSNGIFAMSPNEKFFALKKISNFGILNKNSVNGNELKHLFLDQKRKLNIIDNSLNVTELDYSEYFENFGFTLINYDNLNDRFYICDGQDNYILTRYGLTSSYQQIISCDNIGVFLVGNFTENELKNTFIKTGVFDINNRGIDTVESMEISSVYNGNLKISIDYRYNNNDDFNTTRSVVANPKGIVRLPCAAVDFRINLDYLNFEDFKNLFYMLVKFKRDDKINVRGVSIATESVSR